MANYKDMDYDRVFVSLDGTDRQDKVLERAILVAANNNADLYIGHVIDSTALETAGTYPVDLIPELERGFRASIADGVARAEAEPEELDEEIPEEAIENAEATESAENPEEEI